MDFKIGILQLLGFGMQEAMVGSIDLSSGEPFIGMKEAMLAFPDWTCAVVGFWDNGGNGWKLDFVELSVHGMKEAVLGFLDLTCAVICH